MVRIIEVGPRDGLQNERQQIGTAMKAAFVADLAEAGLGEIEVTSFVSPKWVPQLGDAEEILAMLPSFDRTSYSAVVPNMRGLERALAAKVTSIAVLTSASESFQQKNTQMSVEHSLRVISEIIEMFRASACGPGKARAYLSTAFECPYEGRVSPTQVVHISKALHALGVDEISISDTIGVAVPNEVDALLGALESEVPIERIACHFHDTRGTAIANVAAALERGIRTFDASAGGLGGCPYAPGAGGNLATEDLVYFLERTGMDTGVDLQKLAQASLPIMGLLGRAPTAKSQVAVLSRCSP